MQESFKHKNTAALLAVPALALLLAVAGCHKPAPVAEADTGPKHPPAVLTDDPGWKAFYQDAIARHSDGVEGQKLAYYLSAPGTKDYDEKYKRQQESVSDAVARGVLPGNMLAFMSPDSTKMADLIVASFAKASPGSLKKVFVLFVGKAEDNARVKAAVEPSGVTYRFVEAK